MARVFLVSSKDKSIPTVFVVDQAVGSGCPNKRDDVLLVQHLLRVAWEDAPNSKGFRPPTDKEPLKADGAYGPTTQRFITFFQEEAKRRGANVLRDHRVDPVASGASMSGGTHSFYTIMALNAARNSRRGANIGDIGSDPGFPAELKKSFYVNW